MIANLQPGFDMSAQPFDIRRATEADVAMLARHRVSMFRDMGKLEPSLEAALLDAATTQIREAMAAGEYVAWLARPSSEPSRIVAGVGVQLRRLLARPREDGNGVLTG